MNHAQHVGHYEGRTSQQCVDCVQNRSHEQEREFDWLGDTSQEGGQGRRDHDTTNLGTIFRLGCMPHGDGSSRQTVHLEHVATSQLTEVAVVSSTSGFSRGLIASQNAMHFLPGFIHTITGLEEERNVPDMVQTKWDQGALNNAINTESQFRVLVGSPIRERLNSTTDRRPNES